MERTDCLNQQVLSVGVWMPEIPVPQWDFRMCDFCAAKLRDNIIAWLMWGVACSWQMTIQFIIQRVRHMSEPWQSGQSFDAIACHEWITWHVAQTICLWCSGCIGQLDPLQFVITVSMNLPLACYLASAACAIINIMTTLIFIILLLFGCMHFCPFVLHFQQPAWSRWPGCRWRWCADGIVGQQAQQKEIVRKLTCLQISCIRVTLQFGITK